jgi:hypothetical protein
MESNVWPGRATASPTCPHAVSLTGSRNGGSGLTRQVGRVDARRACSAHRRILP